MSKLNFKMMATIMLCGSFFFTSCVGSFKLHRKLVSWNQNVTENKFINELIFIALHIVPAYELCYLADVVVLNSIEFWTGNNLVSNVGDVKKVKGENGNYLVETMENGYSITKEGEDLSMNLIYDSEMNSWNVMTDGVMTELLKMKGNDIAELSLVNGKKIEVTMDASGIASAKQLLMDKTFFAER